MSSPNQEKPGDLPVELRQQFAAVEGRFWWVETALAVCAALCGILVSYLTVFISDRFWDTPSALRTIIAAASAIAAAVTGYRWFRRWASHHGNLRALSRLVQKRYRRLGDRLLGIVELADEARRPADFSPELYAAAIRQVATEAREFDFEESVNASVARRAALALGVAVLLCVIPWVLVPAASWNALKRWALPAAAEPRYTLVDFKNLPKELVVAHGEPFELNFDIQYRSFWQPVEVTAQEARHPKVRAKVAGSHVRLPMPPQSERVSFRIRAGDAMHEVTIIPTHRPTLRQMSASINLPAYLRQGPRQEKVENGALAVLEGSHVAFAGEANRPLSEAQLELPQQPSAALKVDAATFASEPTDLDTSPQAAFKFRDQFGLESGSPWRLIIERKQDLPPIAELPNQPRDLAILESEVLSVKAAAGDDYGLEEFGVTFQLLGSLTSTNSVPKRTFKVPSENPSDRKLEDTFSYSPSLYQIPADSIIELHAYARDYFPGRETVETPAYRIHVLGTERHAEMVRQRLESLLAQVEELTRLQEKVTANSTELRAQENVSPEEAARKLGNLREEQARAAAELEQIAREGFKTLTEAARNPAFKEDMLQQWVQNVQAMKEISQGSMSKAAKSLQAAQQKSQQRQSNKPSLDEAIEKENESLAALQRMQKKVTEDMDDLQALTLAQRLRKISGTEKDLGSQLQKRISETIGLSPDELSEAHRKLNSATAGEQLNALQESSELQKEISRFFERTQKKNYGEVAKEMTTDKTGEELEQLRTQIQANISMQAIQGLGAWSEKFNAWAEKLEPKPKGAAGEGAGQGESAAGDQVMKQLIALLRLRQGQTGLREQTRLADQAKESESTYAQATRKLDAAQQKLLEGLSKIETENKLKALRKPLQEAHEAMDSVEGLLIKPQTDDVTRRAHNKTIDSLTDLINLLNEQAKQDQSSSAPSPEEMAALMQMMPGESKPGQGMQPGQKDGGNMSGGSTDRTATAANGDARGKAGEGRNVRKASGVSGSLPTEFREALESYFNALEKETK